MRKILGLVMLMVLASCASSGVQVSQESALQFKEGVTTEAEIVAKLGKPTSVMVTSGTKMISYSGMQYQVKGASFIPVVGVFAGGADYTISSVAYQFGTDGVLTKVTYSTHGGASRLGTTVAPMGSAEPTAK